MNYQNTFNGRLSYMYRHMLQRHKQKNYSEICSRKDFEDMAKESNTLKILFKNWEDSLFDFKLTPTVDRIDNNLGYLLSNIQFLTKSDNCAKGNIETKTGRTHNPTFFKKVKLFNQNEEHVFETGKLACDFLKLNRTAVSQAIKKQCKVKGYNAEYI